MGGLTPGGYPRRLCCCGDCPGNPGKPGGAAKGGEKETHQKRKNSNVNRRQNRVPGAQPCEGGGRGLFSGRAGLLASNKKLLKNSTSCRTPETFSPCLLRMCLRTNSGALNFFPLRGHSHLSLLSSWVLADRNFSTCTGETHRGRRARHWDNCLHSHVHTAFMVVSMKRSYAVKRSFLLWLQISIVFFNFWNAKWIMNTILNYRHLKWRYTHRQYNV